MYRLSIPYPKCSGPAVSWISDFGIFAYYNEIASECETNLNAKAIYVSYTAYEYMGFIYSIKTNRALNLITTSN
jgi:hypothetical protein